MRTNRFGIVALVAAVMLGANCGGPDDGPTDGGKNGGTDGGGNTDGGSGFTVTLKAYSPVVMPGGKFVILVAPNNGSHMGELNVPECENTAECSLVIAPPTETSSVKYRSAYENFLISKLLWVSFFAPNYVFAEKKKVTFAASGEVKEVRWGEGEGGLDPGGKTYRCQQLGTFSDVRAVLSTDRTKVFLDIGCGPNLTLTNFEGECSDSRVQKGNIASDFSSIHFEQWRNGVLEASCDALVQ